MDTDIDRGNGADGDVCTADDNIECSSNNDNDTDATESNVSKCPVFRRIDCNWRKIVKF